MESADKPVVSHRRKSILMLATLMASATYAVGFNPPGGVWQDSAGHLPGDPIMRSSHYRRYLVFFYFNAAAFALSLMVVVLTLILTAAPKKSGAKFELPLQLLMGTATLSFMAAYGTAACRDKFRVVFYSLFMSSAVLNLLFLACLCGASDKADNEAAKYRRKFLAPLSMFALTISYVGGLSTPGGFWDRAEGGHRPGDTILHGKLLHLFFYFNTQQFVTSFYAVYLVMSSGLEVQLAGLLMKTGLFGLMIAYTVGSSRGRHTAVTVICSLFAAVGAYIILHVAVRGRLWPANDTDSTVPTNEQGTPKPDEESAPIDDGTGSTPHDVGTGAGRTPIDDGADAGSTQNDDGADAGSTPPIDDGAGAGSTQNDDGAAGSTPLDDDGAGAGSSREQEKVIAEKQRSRASSLVQLLAGLAVSITYQAGMYPPGGVWQDGHRAGDPILLTTNPGRYKAFFYCNSVAFVASLLAIYLGQKSYLIEHHALQAAMILDLLSLVVAYAIGSCRDQVSTMYALGIAAAAIVYVVVHVQYFTLGSSADKDEDVAKSAMVDKKGGRFLLFAILVASVTYQAGLTPPGGFLLQDDIQPGSGHRVGDPVLQYNYPRRYKAFFYCNSVSFMMSTVLLLLLVNPNLYRPAIRSHALSLCSAVSFICLIGAFAAGSSQHMKTSIYIFVLAVVAFFLCLCLPLLLLNMKSSAVPTADVPKKPPAGKPRSKKPIYLMTLAILVGSATYQAGLDPPGGSWQSSSEAGHPVMGDNRRSRYLAFLCGNTTSFVASIYLIEVLLFGKSFPNCKWFKKAIEPTVVAQYLGFLVAYAAGSSRQWRMSLHVGTLVIAVLAYVTIHVMLSYCRQNTRNKSKENSVQQGAQG